MKLLAALLLASLCLLSITVAAQQPPAKSWWDADWKFLVGEWVSGQGGGWARFQSELQNRVLVRTDHSEYPATKDRPAFAHDGLMVIYAEPGGHVRADYWDNEGHAIRYTATSDGKRAVFVSDAVANQPRYRLTYTATSPGEVTVKFELAPPDKPDQFRTYVEATTRRR
jgi:hypothetical protein